MFYIPSMWKLIAPPRVHFFLWLLSNNKILTRDNLEKRRILDDNTCVFSLNLNQSVTCFMNV
jgi:hypothetical protein